RFFTFVSLWD
ncbi:ribonucleotide reductase, small chain family protein, partial [Chlamydia psittaci 06-1683]